LRRYLLFIGLLLTLTPAKAGVLSISQFGGLNTDDAPLALQDGSTPDSENVLTDVGPGLTGRLGFIRRSTSPATAGWQFQKSNGTRYLIIRSGTTLKASTDGQAFTITVATVAATVKVAAAGLGDRFYFVNQTDGLKYWDGSTTTVTVDGTMLADKLVVFKGRLAICGRTTAPRVIYLSKYLDGTNFTAPANPSDDDAATITVSGALDENIQGIYSTFGDKLMYFKSSSFGGVLGSRRSNFVLRTFSDAVGLSSPETVQDCDGKLRWLGANRKMWEFDGANLKKISAHNDTQFANVIQGDSASRSLTLTTAADWAGGTSTGPVTTTIYPGDLAFQTWKLVDDWSDGNFTSAPVWTVDSSTFSVTSTELRTTAPTATIGSNIHSTSTAVIGTWQIKGKIISGDSGGFANWSFYPIAGVYSGTDTYNGNFCRVQVAGIGSSGQVLIQTPSISTSATVAAIGNGYHTVKFTRDSGGLMSLYYDGTLMVSATDTTITASTFTALHGGTLASGPTFGWDDYYFSSDPLNQQTVAISTTATYNSSVITIGSAISSWGPLTVSENNFGSTIQYEVGSSATASTSTITNWQVVTNGNIPTITTNTYAAVRIKFDAATAGVSARIGSVSLGWGEGSTIVAASAYANQRYWLAVAISSTANNYVLVDDRNEQWQRFSGIAADAMFLYNSSLYFANTSGVFQAESGYTDNGAAITSYYRTKTVSPGGLDLYSKYSDVILTTQNSDSTIQTKFRADEWDETTMATVSMNRSSGLQSIRQPFSVSGAQQSRFIDFKWTVTGSAYWRLLNANLYFTPDTAPE
jgi:hypothetical protein